jgi:hypothetical protein
MTPSRFLARFFLDRFAEPRGYSPRVRARAAAKRVGRSTTAILLGLVINAMAAPAVGADVEALLKKGIELRKAGKDAEALECFRQAYTLEPTPRALAQEGLAEQALGRWLDAETHLVAALGARKDAWISKYRSVLETSREAVAQHLGSLQIDGQPVGARILIDGNPAGVLPFARPLRLPVGTVAVEVTAPGHVGVVRRIDVAPGIVARETIELAKSEETAPVATSPTPAPAPHEAKSTRASPATAPPADAAAPPSAAPSPMAARRRAAWITLWSAAGLAVVGGAGFGVRQLEALSYDAHCKDIQMQMQTACRQRESYGNAARIVGIAGVAAAGAAGIVSAVLFLTSSRPSEGAGAEPPKGQLGFSCAPDIVGRGLGCAGRF